LFQPLVIGLHGAGLVGKIALFHQPGEDGGAAAAQFFCQFGTGDGGGGFPQRAQAVVFGNAPALACAVVGPGRGRWRGGLGGVLLAYPFELLIVVGAGLVQRRVFRGVQGWPRCSGSWPSISCSTISSSRSMVWPSLVSGVVRLAEAGNAALDAASGGLVGLRSIIVIIDSWLWWAKAASRPGSAEKAAITGGFVIGADGFRVWPAAARPSRIPV
jgi:hypothetical protein